MSAQKEGTFTKFVGFMGVCLLYSSSVFATDPFLANWMGHLEPILGQQTLLGLTLPGSHDSLTYDLSDIVSDGGDDNSIPLSNILHFFSELGLAPGGWIRKQAHSQTLTLTEQLDNGIRFIDFRTMLTNKSFQPKDWYGLHFVQTQKKAMEYLQEIHTWIVNHPSEVVVIWTSKHGDPCATGENQYPTVPIAEKQKFWASIEALFSGLLLDTTQSILNETPFSELIKRNHRVVFFTSDYAEFTTQSKYATDACLLDNALPASVDREVQSYQDIKNLFVNGTSTQQADNAAGKFSLISLASSGSQNFLLHTFFADYTVILSHYFQEKCAADFSIPGMTAWCPENLLNIAHLANYYSQASIDWAVDCNLGFPNAIYLDAIEEGGTIGTHFNSGTPGSAMGFSYVDSLLLVNVKKACTLNPQLGCDTALSYLTQRRAQHPVQQWNDPAHGRLMNWPVTTPACPG